MDRPPLRTDPARSPAPSFTLEELSAIAVERFGAAGSASELVSSIDRNARIEAPDGPCVLKVMNADEDRVALESQIEAIEVLHRALPGSVPRVHRTASGDALVECRAPDGRVHLAWMITLLPGTLLADASNITARTRQQLGALLGRVHVALAEFRRPWLARPFRWSLGDAAWTIGRSEAAAQEPRERRELLLAAQLAFLGRVKRNLARLPRAVLHNDANPRNLVVDESEGEAHVTGLFDFGDMVYGPRVFDLAIAGAYAAFSDDDALAPMIELARGYDARATEPLSALELGTLLPAAAMRLVLSLTVSGLDARVDPENAYVAADREDAWDALSRLQAIDPEEAERRLRAELGRPGHDPTTGLARSDVLEKRKRHFAGAMSLSYDEPLELVRGEGAFLFDKQGRPHLDCVNNVCHVGHSHPHVVAAAAEQMAALNTNTRYLHDNAVRYAERLTGLFPDPLEVVFFVNSGSEANELALRLARAATGRRDMLVSEHGYHGNTSNLVDLSHYKHARRGGAGTPDWVHVTPCPDPLRRPAEDGTAPGVAETLAAAQERGRPIAGMLVEPLIGCGGQVVPPDGWLKSAFEHVRAAGGVCIADEVQVGFGRVGTHWWAFDQQGAAPDIVTLGKPIGNGHPLGAVVTTRAIADAFTNGMEWFNTFGGNPVSCAIGLAVLDVIESERLRERAREVGARLLEGFRRLAEQHDFIAEARGRGLYLGLEFVRPASAEPAGPRLKAVIERCKKAGVLLSADGPHNNVLKVKPPLAFGMDEAEMLLATLKEALKGQPPSA